MDVFFLGSDSLFLQLSKVSAAVATQTPTVIARDKAPVDAATAGFLNYVTLSSFSWDQDNEKVKVLVLYFDFRLYEFCGVFGFM